MVKPVYKAASDLDFFISMLFRLAYLAVIVYLWFHYEENPAVIIALSLVCLLFFLLAGNDEITVYPDKLIKKDTSVLSLFSKGKCYNIAEIKSASIPQEAASTADEVAIALFLGFILPRSRSYKRNSLNVINLEFKNGKIIKLLSSLEEYKMKEIAGIINSLIADQSS